MLSLLAHWAHSGLLSEWHCVCSSYALRDNRRGTVEVYDLRYDPGELRNRVGDMTPNMRQALLQLDQFFRVHTYRVGGYSPPYRP
jgi:hypothetical protein